MREWNEDDFDPANKVFAHKNREGYDVLGKKQSENVLSMFRPKFVFSAHTHYYCRYEHNFNNETVQEVTIPTFNWRNRSDPSFALVTIVGEDVLVRMCALPKETMVGSIYLGALIIFIGLIGAMVCSLGWTRRKGWLTKYE